MKSRIQVGKRTAGAAGFTSGMEETTRIVRSRPHGSKFSSPRIYGTPLGRIPGGKRFTRFTVILAMLALASCVKYAIGVAGPGQEEQNLIFNASVRKALADF